MNIPVYQAFCSCPVRALLAQLALFCLVGLNVFLGIVTLTIQAAVVNPPAQPVILMTGFEPFGKERPPNPSWEGIKDLNNTQWHGHRLFCKQMRVVWGEPLKELPDWIEQYHPVAVFCFGQGGPRSFTIESIASNYRKDYTDNSGERPTSRTIVSDGPELYHATLPCDRLVDLVLKKGYPIRVSKSAGQYLCEETLYTLEHLKATRYPRTHVLFCHVPPLNVKIGDRQVTPAYAQEFVKDFLDTWSALGQGETPWE